MLKVAANTLDFDPEEFLDVVGPRVRTIHLHTNGGDEDAHWPVERGSWAYEVWERYDVATTVEARFDDVEELSEHVTMLSAG